MRVSPAQYVAPFIALSGASALAYQVTWLREFRLLFGASTAASATVLALFVAGLGIGGLWLGPRADRHPKPFLLYARLELLIAGLAALSPALLWTAKQVYLMLGGTAALGAGGATVVRILLAAPILGPPTILMGGTLPAISRAVESESSPGRRNLALLYAVNTLGSVVGALVTTFVLLEALGNHGSLWLASFVNFSLALAALRLAPRLPAADLTTPRREGPPTNSAPRGFVLIGCGVVGFVFFLMEIVWYRMLAPILGGTVFTMGLILATVLFGVGTGGLCYAKWHGARAATLSTFTFTCVLEAACLATTYALGDRVAVLAARLQSVSEAGFLGQVIGWAIVTSLVVLPAAVIAGLQFPLLIALLGSGRRDLGRHTGEAYAFNTVGAVLGALAGGFGLIPLLGAPRCWTLSASLLLALAAVSMLLDKRVGGRRPRASAVLVLAGTLLLLVNADGPTAAWRHSGIGVGRFQREQFASANGTRDFLQQQRRALLWETDGVESSVALMEYLGMAFVVNGKVDGHVRFDAPTQVMSGLLGALLHGTAKTSLVVGLGTGSTAGWLAKVASVERVDVVELEPALLEVARTSSLLNQNVLDNPKVHVIVGDGREVLLTSRKHYDLIISEPSNPYRAGIASLFTHEFYEAVRRRLTPGGVFIQWLQAYEIDAGAAGLVYATVQSSFPYIETWRTHRDLLLVATREPLKYSSETLNRLIVQEPYRTGLLVGWRVADLEGLLSYFVADASFARTFAARGRSLNSDDRNSLEFGFARSVGRKHDFGLKEMFELSRSQSAIRPASIGGGVAWQRVEQERARLYEGGERVTPQLRAGERATPAELLDLAAQQIRPNGVFSPELSERLREFAPAEADVVVANHLLRASRYDEALVALERAFEHHRHDPWCNPRIMRNALQTAQRLAKARPALALRIVGLLSQPFAARSLGDDRIEAAFNVASQERLVPACVQTLAPFEPWVPWDEAFLERRLACYEQSRHPESKRARQELEEFVSAKPQPP